MIRPNNFENWTFDYFEGNLSQEEVTTFEKFLSDNPSYESDMEAWRASYVAPVQAEYPNINLLSKDRKFVVAWYQLSAVAVLLVGIGFGSYALLNTEEALVHSKPLQTASVIENYSSKGQFNAAHIKNRVTEFAQNTNNFKSAKSNNFNTNLNSIGLRGNNKISNGIVSQSDVKEVTKNENSATENDNTESENESSSELSNLNQNDLAINQAKAKLTNEETGKYLNNPTVSPLEVDLKHSSAKSYKTFSSKVSKFYNKIERKMGYPVGLKNLRDPELLVPQNTLMAVNPGFAGGMLASRFDLNYRNQFFGNDLNSQELSLSFDTYAKELRGGIGVVVNIQDYGLGKYNDMNVSLAYSPKFRLSKNIVFEPAISLTMGALSANTDELESFERIEMDRGRILNVGDISSKGGSQRSWYKDFNLGGIINTKWLYAGFSAANVGGHFENIYVTDAGVPVTTDIRYNAILGSDYESRGMRFGISPFLSYTSHGGFNELWGGVNSRIGKFTIGGSISNNLDYSGSIGLKFERFKLIYRYDNARSLISNKQLNSHNIGIRINTKQKNHALNN